MDNNSKKPVVINKFKSQMDSAKSGFQVTYIKKESDKDSKKENKQEE